MYKRATFLLLPEEKKKTKQKQPSDLNFLLSRGNCESSLLSPIRWPSRLPWLPLIVPARITGTTTVDMTEAEESPGSPWSSGTGSSMKTKEAVLCFVSASACRCTTPLVSLVGLSSEGGWDGMSRYTLFLSSFPCICIKTEFPPNCRPATQGPNLPFSSFLFWRLSSSRLILTACTLFCVHVQLHVWKPVISSFSCIKLTCNTDIFNIIILFWAVQQQIQVCNSGKKNVVENSISCWKLTLRYLQKRNYVTLWFTFH